MPDVKISGLKMHYVEEGSGEAAVFVHGLTMDHTMYAPQFEDLPDQFRCIALDLRGHGRSACPPGPWTLQDSVDDVIGFIEEVDAAPCHLVGMSWGGMIAVRIVVQRPELVRSLVMIDSSADVESPDVAEMERGFVTAIDEQGMTDELIAAALPLLYGERYRADERTMATHVDRMRSMPPEGVTLALSAILDRDSVVDRLGAVTLPALVIHGGEDAAIPMSTAEQTAAAIPGAKLVRIPGAGHCPPLEAPDDVNAALSEFLGRAG